MDELSINCISTKVHHPGNSFEQLRSVLQNVQQVVMDRWENVYSVEREAVVPNEILCESPWQETQNTFAAIPPPPPPSSSSSSSPPVISSGVLESDDFVNSLQTRLLSSSALESLLKSISETALIQQNELDSALEFENVLPLQQFTNDDDCLNSLQCQWFECYKSSQVQLGSLVQSVANLSLEAKTLQQTRNELRFRIEKLSACRREQETTLAESEKAKLKLCLQLEESEIQRKLRETESVQFAQDVSTLRRTNEQLRIALRTLQEEVSVLYKFCRNPGEEEFLDDNSLLIELIKSLQEWLKIQTNVISKETNVISSSSSNESLNKVEEVWQQRALNAEAAVTASDAARSAAETHAKSVLAQLQKAEDDAVANRVRAIAAESSLEPLKKRVEDLTCVTLSLKQRNDELFALVERQNALATRKYQQEQVRNPKKRRRQSGNHPKIN